MKYLILIWKIYLHLIPEHNYWKMMIWAGFVCYWWKLKKHPLNLLNNIQKDLNQIVISTLFTQVNDLEIKAELFK